MEEKPDRDAEQSREEAKLQERIEMYKSCEACKGWKYRKKELIEIIKQKTQEMIWRAEDYPSQERFAFWQKVTSEIRILDFVVNSMTEDVADYEEAIKEEQERRKGVEE